MRASHLGFLLATLLGVSAAAQPAQSITIGFQNVPLGTPLESIAIPGVTFRSSSLNAGASGWYVADLSEFAAEIPPGKVTASGRALVLRREASDTDWRRGEVLFSSPFLRLESYSAVVGSFGCWGGYEQTYTAQPCSWTFDSLQDVEEYEKTVSWSAASGSSWPALPRSLGFSGNRHGYGPKPNGVKTFFITSISMTGRGEFPPDCFFGAPVELVPHAPGAAARPLVAHAGGTVTLAWNPISFASAAQWTDVVVRHYGWMVRVPGYPADFPCCAFKRLGAAATSAVLSPPARRAGDWKTTVAVEAEQTCDGGKTVHSTEDAWTMYVVDRPPPMRIWSIAPSVAPPGSTVVIRGEGFVGTTAPSPASAVQASADPPEYRPPGPITVRIRGVAAAVEVVDETTLRVVIPTLLDGPADLTIETVYERIDVAASSGLTIGDPKPKRRAATH